MSRSARYPRVRRAPGPQLSPDQLTPLGLDPRIELAAVVGAAVVVLATLLVLAVALGSRHIESKLTTEAVVALRLAGVTSVGVEADGVDVALFGTVQDDAQAEQSVLLVAGVTGVGVVDGARLVVPPAGVLEPEPVLAAETIVLNWSRGLIAVTGSISSEAARGAIVSVLEDLSGNVDTDGLIVEEHVASERDWLPEVMSVARSVDRWVIEGTIFVDPDTSLVLVVGEVDSRRDLSLVSRSIEEILSTSTFDFASALAVRPSSTEAVVDVSTSVTRSTEPPAREVAELQVTLDDLIEDRIVEFEFGSSLISEDGRALLDEVIDALERIPNVRVLIAGHTDDVGSDEGNLLLSRLRAAAVLTYLVDRGQPSARFDVIGYGEARPIADNSTEFGRSRNRRIEFTALSE